MEIQTLHTALNVKVDTTWKTIAVFHGNAKLVQTYLHSANHAFPSPIGQETVNALAAMLGILLAPINNALRSTASTARQAIIFLMVHASHGNANLVLALTARRAFPSTDAQL